MAPGGAGALTLDWDIVDWSSTGTRTETYTVGSGDVTITVTDANNVIDAGTGPSGSPGSLVDSNFLDPVGNGGAQNLFIKTVANTSPPWVEVTVDFTHVGGVTNVLFSFFDVDQLDHIFPPFIMYGYTDEITVTATDGSTVYNPTSVTAVSATPSWTFDGVNTLTGIANADQTGGNSADGTAVVSFDQIVNRIRFVYRNVLTDGESQWIGFSSVTFQEAPEPSSVLLLGCALAALSVWRRARR